MTIFKLPDLGEGLPDAEINQWHVKVGDIVKVDDLLVSMETAKAVVDVPSPYNGKITKLYGKAGDIIKTEAPLIEIAEEGSAAAAEETRSADSGTVAGTIEVGDTIIEEPAMGVTPTQATEAGIKAMPAVRALARQLNVDLASIKATGPNGQITVEDVKKASAHATSVPSEMKAGGMQGIIEPLRGVRRTMATVMAQSHSEVVPITLLDDADIQAWPQNTDITLRVIRALIAGCKAEPALNAYFDSKNLARQLFKEVNLGIAIDSKEGLFVPVLKHVDIMNSADVRKTIDRFKEEVRNRSIPPDELKGATIHLSNFGTFAGRYANPIIVPPIVAILGTGRIRTEVVAVNNSTANHRILPLSLSVDHRAVTGGEAARFLAAVIADLQQAE